MRFGLRVSGSGFEVGFLLRLQFMTDDFLRVYAGLPMGLFSLIARLNGQLFKV